MHVSEVAEKKRILLHFTFCSSLFSDVNLECVENVNLKRKKRNLFPFLFNPEEVEENLYRLGIAALRTVRCFWERRKENLFYNCRKLILPCVQ